MKRYLQKSCLFSGILIVILMQCACDNKPTETENANRFINDCFDVFYLWNDELPNVNYKKESDSYSFFKKMKYKDDQWSTLTNDVQAMEESFSGEETTFGYSLNICVSELKDYFGVIRYVYPDSPAEKAGLKRGDIIMKIDGKDITKSNYSNLYYASSITLGMGKYENEMIELTGETVSMDAVKTYMNPVIDYRIIDKGTQKIAYLHYSDYLLNSHDDLRTVFSAFKNAGVSDLVLDLRYNGGGYAITSQFLCSMCLPREKLNGKNVYLNQVWNDDYMSHFKSEEADVSDYFTSSIEYTLDEKKITETIDINLGLSKIYILTGKGTASASEATIVGLIPYIDVITIGETTHGKFCGGSILSPDRIYYTTGSSKKWFYDIRNWGAYMMLYRYSNANGYPEDTNGLAPNCLIEEDIVRYPYALGDEKEPLLAKAIELITGITKTAPAEQIPAYNKYQPTDKLKIPAKALDGKMISDKPHLYLPLY